MPLDDQGVNRTDFVREDGYVIADGDLADGHVFERIPAPHLDLSVDWSVDQMLGYIRTNAPETKGTWDVATVPGGSGNWGGSFATVPTQGKHQKQAIELAKWLTDPAQALTVYQTLGNFPSAVSTWTNPEVADAKDAFFSDAPVGKIFPASLENAPVQVYGPQWGIINTAIGNALTTVEKGTAPDVAWRKVLTDIEAAAGS